MAWRGEGGGGRAHFLLDFVGQHINLLNTELVVHYTS